MTGLAHIFITSTTGCLLSHRPRDAVRRQQQQGTSHHAGMVATNPVRRRQRQIPGRQGRALVLVGGKQHEPRQGRLNLVNRGSIRDTH